MKGGIHVVEKRHKTSRGIKAAISPSYDWFTSSIKTKASRNERKQMDGETNPSGCRAILEARWTAALREEEEFLLPAYAEVGDIEHPLIKLMLEEHKKIRASMDLLLKQSMATLEMNELGHLLEDHIRREEREIFPMIEQALPEDKLQQLAPYLH